MKFLIVFITCLAVLWGLKEYLQRSPAVIGLTERGLHECPETPNCVCSQTLKTDQSVQPLRLSDSEKGLEQIKRVMAAFPGAELQREEGDYLHYTVTTKWLGFIDDVEFLYDATQHVAHVRSASRVGRSDLGVNRKRVEAIRRLLLGLPQGKGEK